MNALDRQLKTAYLCAQGPSISLLDKHIDKFIDKDVDWCALNKPSLIQNRILNKIGKKLSLIYCSSEQRWNEDKDFIMSQEKCAFITNHQIALLAGLECGVLLSSFGYGFNSLFACLVAMMRIGYHRIYIFGADGHVSDLDNAYFGQDAYDGEDFDARRNSIKRDTQFINKYFWELTDYWGINRADIINVGMDSSITCFPKTSILELI